MRISLSGGDQDRETGTTANALFGWVMRRRFRLLLASLVLLMLISPFVDGDETGSVLVTVLFSLVMLAAVVTASGRMSTLVVALCFALPWVYLSWLHPNWSGETDQIIASFFVMGLAAFVLVLVLSAVIRAERVTLDNLCGAIAVYLLIAVIWAVSYGVIEGLAPGSFAANASAPEAAWTQMLYFSLVTLTTLGYGDVTPVYPVAKVWSALEAVTGTLYMAVLIARLVSQYRK